MSENPWSNGVLPIKLIELICIGLSAACTNLQPEFHMALPILAEELESSQRSK